MKKWMIFAFLGKTLLTVVCVIAGICLIVSLKNTGEAQFAEAQERHEALVEEHEQKSAEWKAIADSWDDEPASMPTFPEGAMGDAANAFFEQFDSTNGN